MESCPFCGAEVAEDLVLYGGSCPACFNEIPGEEAPTNPGEQALANAEVEAAAARKRSIWPVVAGVAVLLVGVVGGVLLLGEEDEPELVELSEIVIDNDLSAHVNPDLPEDEQVVEAVAQATPAVNRTAPPTGGQVTQTPSAPVNHGSVAPSGGINSFDPGVSINPLSGVSSASSRILTSESEINNMISQALGAYQSRLQKCYNNRLLEQPDLKGTWNIAFTITRTGKTARINVAARDVSDSTLESCLSAAVAGFSFQKIAQEKPVSLPVRFGT